MKRKSLLLATAIMLAHRPDLMAQVPAADVPESQENETVSSTGAAAPDDSGITRIITLGEFIPDEKRSTAAVANILDAEDLQRAGDSNIAEGLKRVSGLNLSGGKFIYIRGLGERYSSAMVNGAILPSPEPITRAVPLDLFPSSIIDSALVQKTYSAQYPAEFAGGTIQLRTKVVPDEPFFELSSSIGYNDITSLQEGLVYRGGGRDWLGVDDGIREMPQALKEAVTGDRELRENNILFSEGFEPEELEAIGESLPSIYTATPRDINPDASVAASFGVVTQRGALRLGLMSNLSYSNSWNTLEVSRNAYSPNANGELSPYNALTFNSTQQNVDTSMFWTAGMEYGDAHSLKASLLQIRKMDDIAGINTGELGTESATIRQTRLEWIERDLLTKQVQGEHVFYGFGDDFTVDWHYNESRAKREAPDMREYRYDQEVRTGRYLFCLRAACNQRVWSTLEDQSQDFGISGTLSLETPFFTYTTLKAGLSDIRKDRDADLRRFSFLSQGPLATSTNLRVLPTLEQVINPDTVAPDGFQIKEATRATDNYFASQNVDAYFVEADIELSNSFRLMTGMRWEESMQQVTTFDLFNENAAPIEVDLSSKDVFPMVTGTWILDNYGMQVRLGYSETISRPDFRELSPSPFTHPVTGLEIIGNPDLTVAYIDNYDARWEWYFSADESISIGLFHKNFQSPIEAIIQPGVDNRRTFTNAEGGEVAGIEFDGFRWLDFIHDGLQNWYTSANLTLIDSEVNIKPEDANVMTESDRRLQGQADYIYNIQIGYDDAFKHQGALVFHVTGEKIREAGVLGAPDVIDEAYPELDFNYTHFWSDQLVVSVKARNLLNQLRETTQGGLDFNSYREGRNYSVSLTYNF